MCAKYYDLPLGWNKQVMIFYIIELIIRANVQLWPKAPTLRGKFWASAISMGIGMG